MMTSEACATVERACRDAWGPSIRRQAQRLGFPETEVERLLHAAGQRGVEEVERLLEQQAIPAAAGFSIDIDREGVVVEPPW